MEYKIGNKSFFKTVFEKDKCVSGKILDIQKNKDGSNCYLILYDKPPIYRNLEKQYWAVVEENEICLTT
jgi:hypothetical protein